MAEQTPAIRHQTIIQPSKGWFSLQLGALWQYRELLYFLVWRDIKVRYKQTALGVTWVILQPVVSMVVFTFLFGNLLGVPSGDVPYPIFSFAALLPWNYFASSINKSSTVTLNPTPCGVVNSLRVPRIIGISLTLTT